MSQGLALLRSLIDASARSEFRQVHEHLFLETELPAYRFVTQHYRQHGQLPSVTACAENGFILPRADNPVSYYIDRCTQRAMFNVVSEGQQELMQAMQRRDMPAVLALIQRQARQLSTLETEQDIETLAVLAGEVMEDYEHAHRNPGMQGISLGWSYLDHLTGGVEPGDVVTFAARPGMGKSWLLCHIAMNAWLAGSSVLFVSMEMTPKQIVRRMLGMMGGVNPNFIRRGQLTEWSRDVVYQQVQAFRDGPPFHILAGGFNKSVAAVDAAIQEFSPELVAVDASYLMDPAEKGQRKSWELLTDVAKDMKTMAMTRNKGVLHTVQLNREAEKAKKRTAAHVGGTDAVGQITTIGVDIQRGTPPNETTRRKLSLFKNREGEDSASFEIEFLFNPPSFQYIPSLEDAVDIPVEHNEALDELNGL